MSRLFASAAVRVCAAALAVVVALAIGAVVVLGHRGPTPVHRTFLLRVAGSTMSPRRIQASVGDELSVSFQTDRTEEVRLLGYEKHAFPGPGQTVTLTFPADRAGTFAIELPATGTPLGMLRVQGRPGVLGLGATPDQSATTVVIDEFAGQTHLATAGPCVLALELGPLEPMYLPAQVATVHPKVGEVMLAGEMVMPPGTVDMTSTQAGPGWRRVELHVFDRRTGDEVSHGQPAISIADTAGHTSPLPVATLQDLADGPGDRAFGNDVLMPSGAYAITVRVDAQTARFDVVT